MLKIGLAGFGYWGKNLARNLQSLMAVDFVAVCEPIAASQFLLHQHYPTVVLMEYEQMLNEVDAVVIATPPETHYQLGMQAVLAGKHVFVEKPMALTSAYCREMNQEAEKRKLTIAVDHTFCHTGAVQKVKELIEQGEIGQPIYYDSARVNLGAFQSNCDVIWDLAVHDLAILDYILPNLNPRKVACQRFNHYRELQPDQAFLTLWFDNFNAQLNVSWASPVKLRHTMIAGSQKMIVYDDIEPTEKVKVYDKEVVVERDRVASTVSYRSGDISIPRLNNIEGLRASLLDFVDAVENRREPKTSGISGQKVVYLLEMLSRSADAGKSLEISTPSLKSVI